MYEWLTAVEHVQTAFSDRFSGALDTGLAENLILRRGRMTTMKKLTKAMTRKHKNRDSFPFNGVQKVDETEPSCSREATSTPAPASQPVSRPYW